MMKLVAFSDSHMQHESMTVPPGDVLIVAGDFLYEGTSAELMDFAEWIGTQPHPYKLIVPGNHDLACYERPSFAHSLFLTNNAWYLEDDDVRIEGKHFFGFPWTPKYGDWAFMLPRGERMRDQLSFAGEVDTDVDVFISHGPPKSILDKTIDGDDVGCEVLRDVLERYFRPAVHIFGHIHEEGGKDVQIGRTHYYNVAVCDVRYRLMGAPKVIDL